MSHCLFLFGYRCWVVVMLAGLWLVSPGSHQAWAQVCPTQAAGGTGPLGGIPGVPPAASATGPNSSRNASGGFGFRNLLALDSFAQQVQRSNQQRLAKQRAEFQKRQQAFREFMVLRMKQVEQQQQLDKTKVEAKPVNPRSRTAQVVARLKKKKEDRLRRLAEYKLKRKRGRQSSNDDLKRK